MRLYERKIKGYDSSDWITVLVTSKGHVVSFNIGDLGVFGDAEIDFDDDKLDASLFSKINEIYEKTGKSVIATMEVFGDDVSKYGNVGIKDEEDGVITVERIVEKPSLTEALSNYAIIGRYVLAGGVMDMLKNLVPRNNEIYLTDALDELAERGDLLASCIEGTRYDVGDKFGYIKANLEYAMRSDEIGEQTKEYVKELAKTL